MRTTLRRFHAGPCRLRHVPGASTTAASTDPRAGEAEFRALYKELIEINTTLSVGSCTKASEAMKARLVAAGYPESDLHILVNPKPNRPQDGNLVAILPGTDASQKAILLMAHIDVVEAKREDWVRDPSSSPKKTASSTPAAPATIKHGRDLHGLDDPLQTRGLQARAHHQADAQLWRGKPQRIRWRAIHGAKPSRPDQRRFRLNEGAGGRIDPDTGKYVFNGVQAGEKLYQDFTLEITNPGGHSSRPVPDNAIYRLGAALTKIQSIEFPIEFNDATIGFFKRMGELTPARKARTCATPPVARTPPPSAA